MRNQLQQERERRKLSRAQLADALGVEYETVYRWEAKGLPIPYSPLFKIARLWAIPPSVIIPDLALIPENLEEPVSV